MPKWNALVLAIKDDLMIAHGRAADDRAIVLVVVDAHAPDAGLPLIRVLRAGHLQHDAVPEDERVVGKLRELVVAHRVAVVICGRCDGQVRRRAGATDAREDGVVRQVGRRGHGDGGSVEGREGQPSSASSVAPHNRARVAHTATCEGTTRPSRHYTNQISPPNPIRYLRRCESPVSARVKLSRPAAARARAQGAAGAGCVPSVCTKVI